MLDGYQNMDRLTTMQQSVNNRQIEKTETTAKKDTENFFNQLNKLPNDKQKVEVIEQLNARFNQVLEWQTGNETITALVPQLERQQQTIQQSLDSADSYSSPRPF